MSAFLLANVDLVLAPSPQRRPRRVVQPRELLVGQRARELERRQPGTVQDLVRIGVADAAEQMRIGERALERVALARQRLVKLLAGRLERLDTAGIERAQRRVAAYQLQRRPLLRARFGEEQRAVLEHERREQQLRPHPRLLAGLPPAEPTGDHQVDDQKEGGTGRKGRIGRIVKDKNDALAAAADAADDLAVHRVERGIDRAQHERAVQRDPLEAPPADVARQRLEVDDDVGEFGDVIS